MASDVSAKLRRLERFRRKLPHVSASALSAILKEVAETGLPERRSRDDMRRARDELLDTDTPYGPLMTDITLVRKNGREGRMNVMHPLALLWFAFTFCIGFQQLFLGKLGENPSTIDNPWNLIVYTDEITPGNPVGPDNLRRVQVMYFSFLEFGSNVLCREDAWFCVTSSRSNDVNRYAAGLSQVFGKMLKLFFGQHSTNLAVGGMTFGGDNTPLLRFWAKLNIIVQDGGAHKYTWWCKGDGGCKACVLCLNVFSVKSEVAVDDESDLLTCTATRESELHFATDADLREAVRGLAARAGRMAKGDFLQLEKAIGFTHMPHSLMLDRALDPYIGPASTFMHDWMHCLFANGVWNTLVYLLFEAFIRDRRPGIYELFQGYVALWRWPSGVGNAVALADIFSTRRKKGHRDNKHIRCQASDGLSLCSVLAYFVQAVLLEAPGNCRPHCEAYLAFADIVDFIVSIPRGGVTSELLLGAIERFLALFIAAWGFQYTHSKFHWLLHFAKHLRDFGLLISCFVHERKHRWVKRYADDALNTDIYEKTVLKEVFCHHVAMLERTSTFDFTVGLLEHRPPPRRLLAFLEAHLALGPLDGRMFVSRESRFSALATCRRGDIIVLYNTAAGELAVGEVLEHLSIDGVPVSLVSMWDMLSVNSDQGVAFCRVRHEPELIETDDIVDVVISTVSGDGLAKILLPCHLR